MIPVAPSLTEIDELPGKEIEFSIGDPRWVMRSMADLYSNRELAVTREYSTNARDANIEAGRGDKPIHVTLPSMMNPYFVVRDFGEGMSSDVLAEVYTKFGESTKRDSNEFNGMLGFGSKSAVAYTNTFTVTSIHNGTKTVAIITRKPDFTIVMKILASSRTDEPSGTEVSVPVHNWQEFATKASAFYKFWLPGTVLVNGKEPVHEVGDKIDDGLYYSKGWNTSYVVMGSVPYRVENPQALFRNAKMNFINFVAYADNGDVEFTPSREDLKYTPHTIASLEKIILDYEKKIYAKAKADIDSAKTHSEAYESWSKWTGTLGRNMFADLKFKGDDFKSSFPVIGHRYTPRRMGGPALMAIRQWEVENMNNTLMVIDYPLVVSTRHKQIVREYMELKGLSHRYVIFTAATKVDSPWVDQSKFITWEDLKAEVPVVRKPAVQRQYNQRLAGSWDYWDRNGYYPEKMLDSKKKMYYVTAEQAKNSGGKFTRMLEMLDSDAIVVRVYANRLEKFKRDFSGAEPFMQFVRSQVVTEEAKLLSDEAKFFKSLDHYTRRFIRNLDISKVNDKRFHSIRKILDDNSEEELFADVRKNQSLASECGMHYNIKRYHADEDDFMSKDYPMIATHNYNIHEDYYIYMNAKHEVLKKKEKK